MNVFKTCPLCEHAWATRREFLEDDGLEVVGYQVDFREVSLGLFLFNHRSCQTTLAIRAQRFKDLYDGPVYQGCRAGRLRVPRALPHRWDLQPCPVQCECAWVRALLGILRDWPKTPGSDPDASITPWQTIAADRTRWRSTIFTRSHRPWSAPCSPGSLTALGAALVFFFNGQSGDACWTPCSGSPPA